MWKRDEVVKPPQPATIQTSGPASTAGQTETVSRKERHIVNIGKSVVIKGELSGSEDLTIEGQVEGKIELRQNVLTIGPNGRIKAQVAAKAIVIEGQVTGDITASERIEIRDHGSVDGDLVGPRVAIADGAHFRGSVDMPRQETTSESPGGQSRQPAAAPVPVAATRAR